MTNEPQDADTKGRVVALSGGVGGAKLVLGLYRVLGADSLSVIVNTADDFRHLGLHVSPDLDTVTYVLAQLDNPVTGWGRRDETWSFMDALESLGGETWFRLGDGDLATHVERTRRLVAGETLSEISDAFRRRLGIHASIFPMTDDPVRTVIDTENAALEFQHYFVRERCMPVVKEIRFVGADSARALPAVLDALRDPELRAIAICPSNPFVSVEPILSLPELRKALANAVAPVVAVSPIVGGRALKGPAAKMMAELGLPVTAGEVARYYHQWYPGIVNGFVAEAADRDAEDETKFGVPVLWTDTVMRSLFDRERLARTVLDFADRLRGNA